MRKDIRDFSGGVTDFVYNSDSRTYEVGENFSITKNRSLETRWGSHVVNETNPRPITVITLSGLLFDFNDDIISINGKQVSVFKNDAWLTISGSDSNELLANADQNARFDVEEWNNHLIITDDKKSKPIKIYKDENGDYTGRIAGLPKLETIPTVTAQANDGKSYIYTFVPYYEYFVGDVRFVDYGATVSYRIENAGDMSGLGHYNDISGIPTIVGDNIDASNIKIRIFRSKDAETVEYYVGEVTNGTSSYEDSATDDLIGTNEIIYTDGDAFDNDEPPLAKYLTLNDGVMLYAGLEDHPDRVYQSIAGDVDSVPSSFFESFGDIVTGITAFQSNTIVFTKNGAWRIEGSIEADGSGSIRKTLLSESVGCLNNNSIVRTEKGIFWAGNDGFYYSNGFEAPKRIPDEIEGHSHKNIAERYSAIKLNPKMIKGTYDRKNRRILWTSKNGSQTEIYVYDITFNSFTTWLVHEATSILSINGEVYRGDTNGFVFVHKENYYNDDVVDLSKPATEWTTTPIIHRWKHIQYDFDISDVFKWVIKVTASGISKTDLNLRLITYDDSNGQGKDLKSIEFVSGLIWGDPNWIWGDNRLWTLEPRFNQTRRFPSGKIRCKNKQLEITNATTRLAESFSDDPLSQVIVNATTKAISLVDSNVNVFPVEAIGYNIIINGNSYEIIAQSSDTVVVEDSNNTLVNGQQDWHIEGVPRNQRLNLNSLIFTYQNLDDDGGYYQGSVGRR